MKSTPWIVALFAVAAVFDGVLGVLFLWSYAVLRARGVGAGTRQGE